MAIKVGLFVGYMWKGSIGFFCFQPLKLLEMLQFSIPTTYLILLHVLS